MSSTYSNGVNRSVLIVWEQYVQILSLSDRQVKSGLVSGDSWLFMGDLTEARRGDTGLGRTHLPTAGYLPHSRNQYPPSCGPLSVTSITGQPLPVKSPLARNTISQLAVASSGGRLIGIGAERGLGSDQGLGFAGG